MCIRDRDEVPAEVTALVEKRAAAKKAKDWATAVSYTHLDVYKRQLLYATVMLLLQHRWLAANTTGVMRYLPMA